jgi:hypothetical protein
VSVDEVIPILRFRAGALPCAVAAREVHAIRGGSDNHPPLWRLLGLSPPIGDSAGAWVLGLGDGAASVLVQGPVEIATVTARDFLRRPHALALSRDELIFGFVRLARDVVVLLDIPALVAIASSGSGPQS